MHRADPFTEQGIIQHLTMPRSPGLQRGTNKQSRLQYTIRVGHIHTHPHGTLGLIQLRIDKRYTPLKRPPRNRFDSKGDRLPDTNPRQVGLVSIKRHPDMPEICHRKDRSPGLHVTPLRHMLTHHHTSQRRMNRQMISRRTFALNGRHLPSTQAQ